MPPLAPADNVEFDELWSLDELAAVCKVLPMDVVEVEIETEAKVAVVVEAVEVASVVVVIGMEYPEGYCTPVEIPFDPV